VRSEREERRLGTRPLNVADVETLIACALAEALELALATERDRTIDLPNTNSVN
jgi:hypothetical protein